MTREEAIDELSVIYERLSHTENCANGVYSFADGDYLEAIDMAIEALKAEPTGTDFISRADAINTLETEKRCTDREEDVSGLTLAKLLISALPSADAEPTVIRSKTLLPTKDFKEWAKRIKEVNPNAVVIPCDAEIVSADSVVRCKDCKYSFYDKDYESYNCRKHEYVECFDADDYCSWGERND